MRRSTAPRRYPEPAHARPFLRAPRGFTLVEILLVLTVLAVLAAVVAPSALRFFGDYALRSSAEAVRSDLARARLDAVQEGVPYEFRAEANGERWVVVPAERETAVVGAVGSGAGLAGAAATGAAASAAGDWVPVRSGTLAEGVTFPATSSLPPT
ncbi:prepilin-type N-terminal cleavage/methylation domain-containing protein, partial [Alienimonas sp. DA493]|uniref:prepilin-type N-terminal cleavage/methylation domain-containing protein n=1 Tax=Alienimonas sp. DA493 TaxID=3373605 RepID=UPI003754DAED